MWARRDVRTQDRDLMPEHEDLCVLSGVASRQERQRAEHRTMNK
jgi:hypothetical protein